MRFLDLNCQKAYNPNLENFLKRTIQAVYYDFILLQEVDEKVLQIIQEDSAYKLLGAVNPDNGIQSHIRILYLKDYELENSTFLSFSKMNHAFALRAEPGFLYGVFSYGEQKLVVGSVHLHPGLSFVIRAREIKMIKDKLTSYLVGGFSIIFGGDFNLGFPRESSYATKVFAPEFFDATIDVGCTLNSLYTEKGYRLDSRIGNFLARLGVGIKFKTDRVFIDSKTAKQNKVTARVLPDRVSDHSPVEMVII